MLTRWAHSAVLPSADAWFYGYRRLRIRWERRADIHRGFLQLACCLVVFHILIGGFY